MGEEAPCPKHDEPHFYGGQAVIEGVMLRGLPKYAVAIRRGDGEIVLGEKDIVNFGDKHKWAKWPLIRGNVGLIESLVLGMSGLQFSADVLAQEEREALAASGTEAAGEQAAGTEPGEAEERPEVGGLGPLVMAGTMALATLLGIGLFLLLPTWVAGRAMG